ncbi:DUF393 domain-containing protein [Paenibacillus sp. N4]|uniref:thiol-disulfide oxidoreductase DCC family protein n=1 Tax=Paenibacillus vietnamensis TaxID=2590547 RepID=UPI001CD0EDAD|nr:DUF393 domain-containing protein [Paenibacillus vietnamensis]MCA0755252.1 DUF393 domain-containing protein [Paenibacillus vietnamensis]
MNRTSPETETLYVIYDGNCRLCLASVSKLKELPTRSALDLIPIGQLEALEEDSIPLRALRGINNEELYEKIHIVDGNGRVFAGADGIVRILRTVKGLKCLSMLYRIPGMRRMADRLYRYIAARRYEWFGSAGQSCSINGCEREPDREGNN